METHEVWEYEEVDLTESYIYRLRQKTVSKSSQDPVSFKETRG